MPASRTASSASIVAGYDSADTVYAVFNGYDANTPATPGKVFVSRNRGVTWQNISGDLPDVPANALALDPTDPNRIWLATDAAVYATRDGGATWQSERRNMPVVTVMDLVYHAKTATSSRRRSGGGSGGCGWGDEVGAHLRTARRRGSGGGMSRKARDTPYSLSSPRRE